MSILISTQYSVLGTQYSERSPVTDRDQILMERIKPLRIRPSSAALRNRLLAIFSSRKPKFFEITIWVSTSATDPRAWRRKWRKSGFENRACPSAMLLGTETEARRS